MRFELVPPGYKLDETNHRAAKPQVENRMHFRGFFFPRRNLIIIFTEISLFDLHIIIKKSNDPRS